MNCAIYARTSTGRQDIHLQLDALRPLATATGAEVYEYFDEARSGRGRLPELERCMSDAGNKWSRLYVTDLPRLGRITKALGFRLEVLANRGVEVFAVDANFPLDPLTSAAVSATLAAFYGSKSEDHAKAVKRGMSAAARRGKKIGRPKAALREATVRRAVELYHSGAGTWDDIAHRLGVSTRTLYAYRRAENRAKQRAARAE